MDLRPAVLEERELIYKWCADSEATPHMMGPPNFPDSPIPTWEEFCEDYQSSFFTKEGDGFGRVFLMHVAGRDVGCISYDGLENWKGIGELDLWIPDSIDWGKGYGRTAIRQLARLLWAHKTVDALMIRPSERNKQAISAYLAAGFVPYNPQTHSIPEETVRDDLDYQDAIVLVQMRD